MKSNELDDMKLRLRLFYLFLYFIIGLCIGNNGLNVPLSIIIENTPNVKDVFCSVTQEKSYINKENGIIKGKH